MACREAKIALTKHPYQTDNNAHEIIMGTAGKTVLRNIATGHTEKEEDTPNILECNVSHLSCILHEIC